MSKVFPRIRGRAFQQGAAWNWELMITIGPDGATDPIVLGPPRAKFLNKDAACNDMRLHTANVVNEIASALKCPVPTEMIDLKQGAIVDLEEFVKPTAYPSPGGES